MYGKTFSAEFLKMQNRNKSGNNNPQFGIKKSTETLNWQNYFMFMIL
jgi:hypothetical protein